RHGRTGALHPELQEGTREEEREHLVRLLELLLHRLALRDVVLADQALDPHDLLLLRLFDHAPRLRGEVGDARLDEGVVGVGADVGVVVVAPVDDLRVLLAVVRVHDHVHAPELAVGDTVHHGSEVFDLYVVEGPGGGRVVLIDSAHLAELAVQGPRGAPGWPGWLRRPSRQSRCGNRHASSSDCSSTRPPVCKPLHRWDLLSTRRARSYMSAIDSALVLDKR